MSAMTINKNKLPDGFVTVTVYSLGQITVTIMQPDKVLKTIRTLKPDTVTFIGDGIREYRRGGKRNVNR